MKIRTIGIVMLLAISMVACKAQRATETADFDNMLEGMYKKTVPLAQTPETAPKLSEFLILDTRAKEEYDISHLPGAIWVGFPKYDKAALEGIAKDKPILVYCSVGYRSERIGEKLQKDGFTDVQNLYGGIFDWYYHDQPVENARGMATDSIHTYNRKWSQWCLKGEKVW